MPQNKRTTLPSRRTASAIRACWKSCICARAIAYDVARHMSTGDGKVGTTLEQLITAPSLTTSEFVARQNDRAISQRNHIIHNFIDGRVALEAAVKIHQSTGDVSGEAIAATLPGDWHFLFDRPQTAAKQYSEAQRLFVASSADPAGAFLSKPLALPVFAAAAGNASASFTSDANVDSALARFVVDAKGRARNIENRGNQARRLKGYCTKST